MHTNKNLFQELSTRVNKKNLCKYIDSYLERKNYNVFKYCEYNVTKEYYSFIISGKIDSNRFRKFLDDLENLFSQNGSVEIYITHSVNGILFIIKTT